MLEISDNKKAHIILQFISNFYLNVGLDCSGSFLAS